MPNGKVHDSVVSAVGHTPLIRLNKLGAGLPGQVVIKHEGFNP